MNRSLCLAPNTTIAAPVPAAQARRFVPFYFGFYFYAYPLARGG
jgi:hypothetical protein